MDLAQYHGADGEKLLSNEIERRITETKVAEQEFQERMREHRRAITRSANGRIPRPGPRRSDRRLKEKIRYITTLSNGINIYRYNYKYDCRVYTGVLAQELINNHDYRSAVFIMHSGYYGVDYAQLGLHTEVYKEIRKTKDSCDGVEAYPGR